MEESNKLPKDINVHSPDDLHAWFLKNKMPDRIVCTQEQYDKYREFLINRLMIGYHGSPFVVEDGN